MEKTNEATPRRIRLDLMSPAEVAIYNATQEVEKMPGDIRLTHAVIALIEARSHVADFIDDVPFKAVNAYDALIEENQKLREALKEIRFRLYGRDTDDEIIDQIKNVLTENGFPFVSED